MQGSTLNGQYTIVRRLGGGGMGAVYEAQDLAEGRRVAIKVIESGDLRRDKALVGRFLREARATSSVVTPHIVRTEGTGTDAATGAPFMVMEYLEGEDLSQVFKRTGPLPPEIALKIAAQACLGLEKAHEARVVHRDIKPANLFLAQQPDGTILVKLLDFGVAKIKMDQANVTDTTGLTRTGSMIGSPLYMAPEQARGSKSIDHRADLWSLGVVLYQALAGRTPYQDIQALGELIIAICSEPPEPVQQIAPWVPREVAAIVDRALRLLPAERFQSAGEMHAAIMALLPSGLTLLPEMLMPTPPEMRAVVAERYVPPSAAAPPARLSSAGVSAPPLASGPPPIFEDAPLAVGSAVPAGTTEGVARAPASPQKSGRPGAVIVVGLAAIVGVGLGFGLYRIAEAQRPEAVQQSAQSELPSAMPTPAPTPAPAPSTSALASRTVLIEIVPGDAEVELEGNQVKLEEGKLKLTGGLGSVHRLRVSKGEVQTITDIVLTEAGPLPPRIELALDVPSPAPRPSARPFPTNAPVAGAGRPQTSTAKPPPPATGAPTFKDKFE